MWFVCVERNGLSVYGASYVISAGAESVTAETTASIQSNFAQR